MPRARGPNYHESKYPRIKTKYDGVYYILGTDHAGRPEKIFYISFYDSNGKRHFEKAGRQRKDDMTPSRAFTLRAKKMEGDALPNVVRREEEAAAKAAEAGKWTFNRLWEAWKADPENKGKRGTYKADARFKKHIAAPLGGREPKDLIIEDIDRIRHGLAKDHARETTLSVLNLINRIARYGFMRGLCPGLPFVINLTKKQMGREPRIKVAPTDEQIAAYIRTCQEWPDIQARNFQLLLCYTGMRRGSAWNLMWKDVDLDAGRIVLRNTKNTRDIPILLAGDAVELLRNHPRTPGNPYVFTGSDPSGRRSERETSVIPRQIRDAAGLPKTFDPNHIWRINLATQGRQRGVDTFYIQKMGGWESPAMVDHYAKVNEEVLRKNIEMMASAFNGKNASEAQEKSETA
jgi:integrase